MGRWVTLTACALAALPLAACSPFGGGAYQCSTDTDCGGSGICDPSGYCAFPDNACSSGFKFGELSGPRSGQCTGGGGSGSDATVDTPVDMNLVDAPSGCYGTGVVVACFNTPPSMTHNLNAQTINTDTSPLCDTDSRNAAWCVVAGSTVTVAGTVTGTGTRPLVLLSTGTLTINGTLDVASHRVAAIVGAGGDATCTAGTAPTMSSGGAGGSFGGLGGVGAATGGGTGGQPGPVTAPSALRGGCRGQTGSGGGGGVGGHGGGAVYLFASTSISVVGSINASGSGGINANMASSSGGGGGGAGGFIGLESPSVMIAGQVFANGGGGGEASGTGSTGVPGGDSPDASTAAVGGAGGSDYATNGGDGSQGATKAGEAADALCTGNCTGMNPNSGGGGGGGAGIIRIITSASSGAGTISPPPN